MTNSTTETKKCNRCGEVKEATTQAYAPDKRNKSGLQGVCRECHNKSVSIYRKTPAGKAVNNRAVAKYAATEHGKAVRSVKKADHNRTYAATANGRAKRAASGAIYRAGVRNAALTSEERLAVAAIYREARRIAKETGVQMHVDHIVPICKGGETHPDNLQILTATENLVKGGR